MAVTLLCFVYCVVRKVFYVLLSQAGEDVDVLSKLPDSGEIVAAQQGKMLVTAFHPELDSLGNYR